MRALVPRALLLVALAGCFQAPSAQGPYRCEQDDGCEPGFVCDDGVCCRPQGDPLCLSYVLDGGLCMNGRTPAFYYEDLDGDGFGNANSPRAYCQAPVFDAFVDLGGDCNDNPAASGELFFPATDGAPGAAEQCDGLDNDCDGVADEGLPGKTVYRDADGDGYGDPAQALTLCREPPGYVDNSQDCQPATGSAHPGAIEVCNDIDDDCDGELTDVPWAGEPCTVSGASGICAAGARACLGGVESCVQTVQPAPLDACNGQDDDCDGTADERPDCRGPVTLLGNAAVQVTAWNTGSETNGTDPGCLAPGSGSTDEPLAVSGGRLSWSSVGVGFKSHVLRFEPASGGWDLSPQGAVFRFYADVTLSPAEAQWHTWAQPMIIVCGRSGGHLALINTAPGSGGPLGALPGGDGRLALTASLRASTGTWQHTATSNVAQMDQILSDVAAIEVLVQPRWHATNPSFVFSVDDTGFP